MLRLILLLAACLCFILAAFRRKAAVNTDLDLVATGLALWVISILVTEG